MMKKVMNEKTGMKGCLDVVQNKMAIPYEYEEILEYVMTIK